MINILVTILPQVDVWCVCCSFPQLLDSALVCRILGLQNSFGLLVYWYQMNVVLRSPHPTSQEQEYRPFANQASSDIISDSVEQCETLMFAACTSNLWEQMFDKLILNLQSHQQNMSLGTDPICSVGLYFPHNNIANIHLYDQCTRSHAPSVCHKLLSIWKLFEQIRFRTNEYQVYQFVPHTSISRRFENIHRVNSFSFTM